MEMEKAKRDDKINQLIEKMDTFADIEEENEMYFEGEYEDMESNMESFFDTLMDNNDRISTVESMMEKQKKDSAEVLEWQELIDDILEDEDDDEP